MSAPRPRFSQVEKEWRRIRTQLRRHGPQRTSEHVVDLIRTRDYPLAYTTRLVELLLKRREYEAAGRIIEAVDRSGSRHPLMDELLSSWTWCTGTHKDRLYFAI